MSSLHRSSTKQNVILNKKRNFLQQFMNYLNNYLSSTYV